MFIAYRTKPVAVKVIGISSGMGEDGVASSSVKFCQLWFSGETVPRTTPAEYVIVPETHDRKSVSSLFSITVSILFINFRVRLWQRSR